MKFIIFFSIIDFDISENFLIEFFWRGFLREFAYTGRPQISIIRLLQIISEALSSYLKLQLQVGGCNSSGMICFGKQSGKLRILLHIIPKRIISERKA